MGDPANASFIPLSLVGGPATLLLEQQGGAMAELLDGTTMHAQFAPLSHAQTISVSRHLQDQIKSLEAQIQDLTKTLKETQDGVECLRKNMPTPNSNAEVKIRDDVRNLQVGTDEQWAALGRAEKNIDKIQEDMSAGNDSVVGLQDDMKNTKNTLSKVMKDLQEQTAKVVKMQQKLDRKMEQDLTALGDGLSTAQNNINSLQTDTEYLTQCVRDEREEMRKNNLRAVEAADRFKALLISFKALKDRVDENTLGRKALKIDTEEMNAISARLRDDHEHTKGNVQELWTKLRAMHDQVKAVVHRLDMTTANLGTADDKLRKNMADTEELKRSADAALNGVHSLGESHGSSSYQMNNMQAQLMQLTGSVMALRAGLKEHSSLLLPNITMDHGEARAASARHGSLLHNGTAGGGLRGATPSPRGASARSRANTPQMWT